MSQAAMSLGRSMETFIEMVFNYQTLSKTYRHAAYDALGQLGRTPE